MDLDLRLAALANLVTDGSPVVEAKLLRELARVEEVLNTSNEYDDLSAALKVLAVLAARFHFRVLPILTVFVRSVPLRELTWGGEPIVDSHRKYRSTDQLVRDAVDVPRTIRYVHVDALLDFLLEIWRSNDKDTSNKAERSLESLAKFDRNLFYGDPPVGARPQLEIVDYFAKMEDGPLLAYTSIALTMLRQMLSPTIEGHTWTFNSVNISRGGIPAGGGMAEMRSAAIALMKRMFLLSPEVSHREQVLQAFSAATRREHPNTDARTSAMFEGNAIEVLNFLRDRVATQEMQVVQAIEHDAYWSYYHAASAPIAAVALEIRDVIDQLGDYKIYKGSQIGWAVRDRERRAASERYLDSINANTYEAWRARILEFAKARSDDLAMFPIFYDFLRALAQRMPAMASDLLRDHEGRVQPFVIALLRGLWASERDADALALVKGWFADRTKLASIAKSLNVDENPRFELMAEIMDEAGRVDDPEGAAAIIEAMGAAAHQFGLGHSEAKAIFLKGMRMLALRQDARWVSVIWFSRDIRKLVESMDTAERAEMLAGITSVKKIGYEAEELLAAIGQTDPKAVLEYLMNRVRLEREHKGGSDVFDDDGRFEAIPFSLHTLDKLLSPLPGELLRAVRTVFAPEEAGMFPYYGGARLIKAVFPDFNAALQAELLSFTRTGHPTDIDFVIGVVRTYAGDAGDAPILDICKEIIKLVPERSTAWGEVATAIESTGVVIGEFGMLEAYETKRAEIATWKNDDDPRVQAFAVWLIVDLEQMIISERERAEAGIALRKHRYGVDKNPT